MNSSVVALISCMSSSDRPRNGRAGMLTLTCFLRPTGQPTWKRRFSPSGPGWCRPWSPNWCVAACFAFVPTREPRSVRRHLDRVAELRGVDEGLPPGGRRPDGGLPPPAVRRSSLLETLKGGLSDAFAEGHVEAPSVYFRVSPHFSEECGGLSFKADTIHELHPPHLRPRE